MRSDLSYSEQRSKTLMQINGQNPLQRVPTKLIHSACHLAGVARGLVPRVSLRSALCQPKRDRRDKPGDDTACVALFGRNQL